ncbi:hypothetical protein [Geotalea toluenoxydans]|uniref:hypothetical protein n=1 Tax=Geotalea toluenoxydans TaxID=421624 RepID=UPI0006CFC5EC|nr:hypothetical protein [Geotalea toluenoxydans]
MKSLLILSAFVLVVIVVIVFRIFDCQITDKEAIKLAKNFYSKMGVDYTTEPVLEPISLGKLVAFGPKSKVLTDDEINKKIVTVINCESGEVAHFANHGLLYETLGKYTETIDNKKQIIKWPPILSEHKAKEILQSLAQKIDLPQDVEYSDLRLDKDNAIWTAHWKRKLNGIPYENDYVNVSIMATDGRFYGFNKWLKGKPCPTGVKISQDEAIKTAYERFADFFPKEKWSKNKDKFELKSAELKIVQDKSLWQKVLGLSGNSRLAWVVVYDTKPGMETETIEILRKDQSFIKVDAISKAIISTEINVVP